jgi:hypothetical protein
MEQVIQISNSFDSRTQLSMTLALTSTGRVFKTYDLEKWVLVSLPDLQQSDVVLEEPRLYGERTS